MILFNTTLPLSTDTDIEHVVSLSLDWIINSPYAKFKSFSFDTSVAEHSETNGDHSFNYANFTEGTNSIRGIRFSRREDSLKWTTDIVIRRWDGQFMVSLQVDCISDHPRGNIPYARKPYLVKMMVEKAKLANDGIFPINDKIIETTDSNLESIATIMAGNGSNILPIVFFSKDKFYDARSAATELAKWVSGQAHVILEAELAHSHKLRNLSGGRNSYHGTIGLYWPQSKNRRLFRFSDIDSEETLQEIADLIQDSMTIRSAESECTWNFLNDALSKRKLESLKEKDDAYLNEYVKMYDTDMNLKNDEISQLKAKIFKLQMQNDLLAEKTSEIEKKPLLYIESEKDLFDGEILSHLMMLIKKAEQESLANSRRHDIFAAIVKDNPFADSISPKIEVIKQSLNSYTGFDASLRSKLSAIGLADNDQGKHIKIGFQSDDRYSVTISKTPSDGRAGKNAAADITKIFF